jgi:DNA-directed RNA polymerase specialized sigma24 family protein
MMVEDRYLVWQVKRGSEEALRRLYNRYETDLLTLAMSLLGRAEQAEDVLQDVFTRFIESIDAFTLAV